MARYNPNAKRMKAYAGKSAGKNVSTQAGLTDSDSQTLLEVRENNAKAIEESVHKAVMTALEEIGLVAEGYAKRACPVDTGRLRNSITHALNMDEEAVYIGSNVSYAPFVEFDVVVNGKQRDGAHFLRDAAQNHGSYYRKIMEQHLSKG